MDIGMGNTSGIGVSETGMGIGHRCNNGSWDLNGFDFQDFSVSGSGSPSALFSDLFGDLSDGGDLSEFLRGDIGRSGFLSGGGGSSEQSKMFSLGSSDLRGVYNRFGTDGELVFVNGSNGESVFVNGSDGELVFMDGSNGELDLRCGGSNGQVGSLNTESQTIGDVVGSLDNSVGINI